MKSEILQQMGVNERNYALVTLHCPSNVDNIINFKRILLALAAIQERLPVVFPVHQRTLKILENPELKAITGNMPRLMLCNPLGYFDFGRLISGCRLVITDSGGIKEESTVYGIPCITIRDNTERPITIREGTTELAGTDTEKIINFSDQFSMENGKPGKFPYYGMAIQMKGSSPVSKKKCKPAGSIFLQTIA